MDGDFNHVVTSVNATFSNQTDLPYKLLDKSTVSLKFMLHKGDSSQKIIYFEPVNEASDFSIQRQFANDKLHRIPKIQSTLPDQSCPTSGMKPRSLQLHRCTIKSRVSPLDTRIEGENPRFDRICEKKKVRVSVGFDHEAEA